MHTMTIEVQKKTDPEKGKKRGRIMDTSTMVFQIEPEDMPNVKVGHKYEIVYTDQEYTPKEGGETRRYRVINKITPVNGGTMTSMVPAAPTPAPRSGSTEVYSDTKTEDISALAIIKSMQIDPEASAVYSALKEAAIGWRRYKKWQKTLASDMDDEIPYDK